MTSPTPVRPLYPFVDEDPPPRKRQKKGEGKDVEELSDDHEPDIYSPAGGSEAGLDDELESDLEGFFEIETEAKKDTEVGQEKFTCPPCDSMPGSGAGLPCAGCRIPKTLNSPIKPSAEEIERHYTNHLPYRNWCPVCVKTKGAEMAHRRGANEPDEEDRGAVPIVDIDYSSLNENVEQVEERECKLKTMVMKDETSGNVFQHKVQVKGVGDEWLLKKMCKDMEELGRRDAVLKSDGEPAIVAVQNKIQSMRSGRTIPRNPPAYNPEANGPIEKAVRDVTAHTRALKIGLESRLKGTIPENSAIMEWILEHAPFLINKFSVGHDGMTPHERLTGAKWRRPNVEIGEVVLAKLVGKKRKKGKTDKQKKKLAEQSVEAIWVGQVARTGEHVVAQPGGDAFRCRTVRRVPIEDRWELAKVMDIKATPRKPNPSRARQDALEPRMADENAGRAPRGPREPRARVPDGPGSGAALEHPEARESDIRDFRITDRILEKFGGYHHNCPGCVHKAAGFEGHRGHSSECRQRLQENMEKDDEGKAILEESRRRLANKSGAAAQAAPSPEQPPRPSAVHVEETEEPEVQVPAEPADVDMGGDTPRFGAESDDECDQDELMELNEDTVEKSNAEAKRRLDKDCDDTDEEPNAKRPKLKRIGIKQPVITTEDERGKIIVRGIYAKAVRSTVGCVAAYELLRVPETSVARTLCGIQETVDEKSDVAIWEKRCEEFSSNLKLLASLREHTEVKKILGDLDESIKVPAIRSQGQSMNAEGKCDVAEVYSPPRITDVACKMALKPGWALDLTVTDEDDGQPWDLSVEAKRNKARARLDQDRPFMLIVCPMCGPFSSAQNFNYINMTEADVKEKLAKALEHVKFAVELCMRQHAAGRLFLFEHPAGASTWETRLMRELHAREGVFKVNFDFCMAGMKVGDVAGDGKKLYPVKKRTGIMTNSHAIYTIFREVQCRGDHVHAEIINGKTGQCQEYPEKFCRMVCEGVKQELETIKWRNRLCETFDVTRGMNKLMKLHEKMDKMVNPPEEDPFSQLYDGLEFIDDISGAPLVKELAIEARKLEIDYFKSMGVYAKIARQPWMRVISTKWIDQNKGDSGSPNYRARLVGREIKRDQRLDLFAATPPLESLKLILSKCASNQHYAAESDRFVIMYNDVKRAYFHAPAKRPVYIKIPDEDFEPGDEDRVGVLNLSLYGTRDAAKNWAAKYTEVLRNIGFQVGLASPCNFYHEGKDISVTVHGDDFTSTGTEANLKWLRVKLKEEFEMKTEVLGPKQHHQRQVRILNRVVSWSEEGLQYEADQRHAEIMVEQLGLEKAKPLATPGTREDAGRAGPLTVDVKSRTITEYDHVNDRFINFIERDGGEGDQRMEIEEAVWPEKDGRAGDALLAPAEAKLFRGLAARLNYLSADRPDLQYAAKEVARRMARPTQQDWQLLKRVGRYLIGAPRAVQNFWWQSAPRAYDTFVDSDWAGCAASCRSTSGGAVKLGWHTVKTWSTTQATVAMSSAEAELFSLTKGAAVTLGLISIAKDLGMEFNATVHSDASAALAIAQRQGLGKLRHLKVQYLWVQERLRGGDLGVKKVDGKHDPADLLTKHLAPAGARSGDVEHESRFGAAARHQ